MKKGENLHVRGHGDGNGKGDGGEEGKFNPGNFLLDFFLGINSPVEKSWQETGRLNSGENHWGGFSKIFCLPPLVMGKKFGILEVGKSFGDGTENSQPDPGSRSHIHRDFNPNPNGNGNSSPDPAAPSQIFHGELGRAKSCVPMYPKRLRIPNNSGSMWDPHPQPLWDPKILNPCPITSQITQELSGIF